MRKLILSLVAVVALVAAACGNDDGLSSTQESVVDNIAAGLSAEVPGEVSQDDVRCVAEGMVSPFSDSRLSELGISSSTEFSEGFFYGAYDLTDAEADQIVDTLLGCLDWNSFVAVQTLAAGRSSDEVDCVTAALTDEIIQQHVRSLVLESQDTDDAGALTPVYRDCVDVRALLAETFIDEGMSEEQAQCVFENLSDEIVDILASGGDEEEFTAEVASQLAQVEQVCVNSDVRALMVQTFIDEGMDEDRARCIAVNLPEEIVDVLVAGEELSAEVASQLAQVEQVCVNSDILALMVQTFIDEGMDEDRARCIAVNLPEAIVDVLAAGEELSAELASQLTRLQQECPPS